jgi:hypothetical protein
MELANILSLVAQEKRIFMNKKLYILMIVVMAHSSVFCMDYTAPGCKRSLIKELGKLHNAIVKARYYSRIPEYQQEVDVKRQALKERFPQEVELLADGRVKVTYITASGDVTYITQ